MLSENNAATGIAQDLISPRSLRGLDSLCPARQIARGKEAKTATKDIIRPSASRAGPPAVLLATAAIVGQIVLLASALILPFFSEFSLVGDTISELVLGRFGVVQTLAFLIAGATTLGLASALWRLTSRAWGSRVGSLLVGLYGVGAVLLAIFPTDRVDDAGDLASLSTTGMIHTGVALVSFIGMIVGMFVLTRTFRREPEWGLASRWMILFPAAALLLLVVQSEGPWVGIMQRLLVGVIAAWIIVVAARIRAPSQ